MAATMDISVIESALKKAPQYWKKGLDSYEADKTKKSNSTTRWMQTMISGGALKDKVAALVLLVQEAPLYQLKSLDILLAMCKKKGRREALMAAEAVQQLWLKSLIRGSCLNSLKGITVDEFQRILGANADQLHIESVAARLYFEEQLKSRFSSYIEALESLCKDTFPEVRLKSTKLMHELLMEKEEQTDKLLLLIMNKLGDPDKKMASKAMYWLSLFVRQKSKMKRIVVAEAERLLFRPNISEKTMYYTISFLNQIMFGKGEADVAARLLSIYFSFFQACMKSAKENEKLIDAIIIGVTRAFPYATDELDKYNDHINSLFTLVHSPNIGISIQTLTLLHLILKYRPALSDRFYQCFYEKLLSSDTLGTSTKQAMFFRLLYKVLESDTVTGRVQAFIRRLLQLCMYQTPCFVGSVLFFVSEMFRNNQQLRSLVSSPQISRTALGGDDDDEEEENIQDADKEKTSSHHLSPKSSWIFRQCPRDQQGHDQAYKIMARNPLYAGAEHSRAWELEYSRNLYHPAVAHFAKSLTELEDISYNGNPLEDFTLFRFLERFVNRNPKKQTKVGAARLSIKKCKGKSPPFASVDTLLEIPLDKVQDEELFFYKYFSSQKKTGRGKKHKVNEGEEDDIADDEDMLPDFIPLSDLEDEGEGKFVQKAKKARKSKKAISKTESDESDEVGSDSDIDIPESGVDSDGEY